MNIVCGPYEIKEFLRTKERMKWIRVEDKMPNVGQRVLVYAVGKSKGFEGEKTIEICTRFIQHILPSSPGNETWSSPYQYFHTNYEITHWMELPEPPNEFYREQIIEIAEEIGIHNLYAMVKEIRGE